MVLTLNLDNHKTLDYELVKNKKDDSPKLVNTRVRRLNAIIVDNRK